MSRISAHGAEVGGERDKLGWLLFKWFLVSDYEGLFGVVVRYFFDSDCWTWLDPRKEFIIIVLGVVDLHERIVNAPSLDVQLAYVRVRFGSLLT